MVNASDDNLKLLIAKGYVIPFESGVVVITHWRQNNYIQKDRFTSSIYQKEKQSLECILNVYKLDTQEGRKEGRLKESSKNLELIKEDIERIVHGKKI